MTTFSIGKLIQARSNMVASGKWIRGKVVGQEGAICIIDIGTAIVRVNQSTLRKDHDDWHDVPVPLGGRRI